MNKSPILTLEVCLFHRTRFTWYLVSADYKVSQIGQAGFYVTSPSKDKTTPDMHLPHHPQHPTLTIFVTIRHEIQSPGQVKTMKSVIYIKIYIYIYSSFES